MSYAMCGLSPKVEMPLNHLHRIKKYMMDEGRPEVELDGNYSCVLIAGMGGSGISGSLIADLCNHISHKPIYVLRVNKLPYWADRNTLVLIISYSGNTREMIDLYNDARGIGCGVVVITSGGKLKEIAERDDVIRLINEGGYMPRSDIGFVIIDIVLVLKANDNRISFDGQFMQALDTGIEYAGKLSNGNDPNNEAIAIAKRIKGKTPIIYSSETIQSVAGRWKAQFNENCKIVSASGVFPEFCHNSLEGWGHNTCDYLVPILLRAGEEGIISEYLDVTTGLLEECGNPFLVVDIPGRNLVEKVMNGIILGDYVSLYLADMLGVDPSPVPTITEFKKRLG